MLAQFETSRSFRFNLKSLGKALQEVMFWLFLPQTWHETVLKSRLKYSFSGCKSYRCLIKITACVPTNTRRAIPEGEQQM